MVSLHTVISVLLLLPPLCLSNLTLAAPPGQFLISFPASYLPFDNIGVILGGPTAGVGAGGLDIPSKYYGFTQSYTVSLRSPNGSETVLGQLGDVGHSSVSCSGGPATSFEPHNGTLLDHNFSFFPDLIGQYTILWNVTYGAYTNSTAIKQTDEPCDSAQFSFRTWTINRSVWVVGFDDSTSTVIAYNLSTVALVPQPTGTILVNGSVEVAQSNATSSPSNVPPGQGSGGFTLARWSSMRELAGALVCIVILLMAL